MLEWNEFRLVDEWASNFWKICELLYQMLA